jgi:probable HAF family extracellular repeat protein
MHRIALHRGDIRRSVSLAGAALLVAACGGGDGTPPTGRATFKGVRIIPGYSSNSAAGVSPDGTVIVGTATTASGQRQGFLWTFDDNVVGLGLMPGGTFSMAAAAADHGSVVVGTADSADGSGYVPSAAFRWTANSGIQRVDPLAGSSLCSGADVSRDGAVITGTCLQVGNTAFRWTAGDKAVALSRFGTGGNQQSAATAISLDGRLIVGVGNRSLTGAVAWGDGGTSLVIGKLATAAEASATDVSADGSFVIGISSDAMSTQAFRWTQSLGIGALDTGDATLTSKAAAAVAGSGDVIVGWSSMPAGDVAIIWDASHGWRRLDRVVEEGYGTPLHGWTLRRATAISEDGRTLAGTGINPDGTTQAWALKLPPA